MLAVEHAPDEGSSSVAAIDSSVDLPAPFGPSSATISPALALEATPVERAATAEVRETSVKVSERKSIARSRYAAASSSSSA